jgi:hypothetical protein
MKKQTKRKIYLLLNPIEHAMKGAAIATDEDLKAHKDRENASLQAFRDGTATKVDWHNLNTVVRLAESLAMSGIGEEVLVQAKIAEMHLLEAYERHARIGKMGTTGLGLQSLQDILEYHDLQRKSIANSVYKNHINSVTNKVRSKSPKIKFL